MANFDRETIEVPDVAVFEEICRTTLVLTEDEKFALAICITRMKRSGVPWPRIEKLSLSQVDLKRVKKIREKAYRAMGQWLACRDFVFALTKMGASVEPGNLKLSRSDVDETVKVIHT